MGGTTRLSLDRTTVRKENLWPKYLKRKGIKDTCSLTDKQTKKEHIYIQTVEQNDCSEQNNEIYVLLA